jgi:serpin B
VLLPAEGVTMNQFEQRLTAENLRVWLSSPERKRVRVMLPKFEFEAEFQLNRTLADMGMPTAFTDQANFGDMIEGGGLAIDDVVHKAYVRVDEKGTEAAAATGVTMRTTSMPAQPPEVFRADRPFVFLIRHQLSGAVLFMGRVVDPRG